MWSPNGGAKSPEGDGLYACPAGAYFCMRKSRQNALGTVPQDPLAAKLRLDTNWTFQQMLKSRSVQRRRYALKVPAAHFMLGNCKPIAGSHDVEPMGWISSYLPRRPLPRYGGGEQGGGKYAVAPYKHRLAYAPGGHSPSGRAFRCVGVLGFTPSRFWALLAIQKCHLGDSRAIYAFAKGPATPTGDYKFGLKFLLLLFMGEKQALPAGGFYSAGKAARRQVRETSER